MKKLDLFSFIAIIAATAGLALLRYTGIVAHVVISAIALIVMVVCAVVGKKDWKTPELEIAYRAFFLIALVTGIVMAASGKAGAIAIAHKTAWGIFAASFIVNFVFKLAKKK